MKTIFLPFLLVYLAFFQPPSQSKTFIEVPLGGNTFQTNGANTDQLDKNGIQSWNASESVWSTYFYSETARKVSVSIEYSSVQTKNVLYISLNEGKFKSIVLKKTSNQILVAGKFNLKKGYNIIHLKANAKGKAPFPKVKNFKIYFQGKDDFKFVRENIDQRFYWGRRGPSVHLSYEMPENVKVKWFYNEMTIPKDKDPIGSYFMSNGFKEGYFGIQVNSLKERRILFSVWSPFPTDNPKEIPDNQKIKLLKKGGSVYTGEFGNEGSGGQSYLVYPWKSGITYQFLTSVVPDNQGNTTYTAYFKDPENAKWILIASFLRPQTSTWYTRAHSFLENFNDELGYLNREVQYQNQWVVDDNGKWYSLHKSKFTGDDIARRQYRLDADGGIKDGTFFLRNGGFFNSTTPLNSNFSLPPNTQKPDIDFNSLP
ncbi:MAG: DUF3472 domain-containing protein [Saprospiraceae bacterium]|nr:DUF3472 domain-containing protein [Saprospiraceae bacterium]MDP4853359.1 DUF3472 domain-containing protein [Saprospiraceae bacterium]